jgi:hypothetical protein
VNATANGFAPFETEWVTVPAKRTKQLDVSLTIEVVPQQVEHDWKMPVPGANGYVAPTPTTPAASTVRWIPSPLLRRYAP